ncbi:YheC/YheD family protein [Paenibacillus sp. N1-5-1-14]|uniref:YheC/YheD family endospore coat-associated protein n=1 Tax=Paenibacillus radicibacter TaxID=2972488 RepID=UPI0021593F4D|nr:YheC/YheD family protein [Paenibacillus radicibacter]MCR8643696.1 YheC/YheD family protein [Paenibacillus radicibacter]
MKSITPKATNQVVGTLGIMATHSRSKRHDFPFADGAFYRGLSIQSQALDIQAFVFSPLDMDWSLEQVKGYSWNIQSQSWQMNLFPFPELIYDRCFYASRRVYQQYQHMRRKLSELPGIRFLSYGLPGKWEMYQTLRQVPEFIPYLPVTAKLSSAQVLLDWLKRKGEAFMKPNGGSQGRGILKVTSTSNENEPFHITGRSSSNESLNQAFPNFTALWRWIRAFIGKRDYLVQDSLSLHTEDGVAFDIRSLVQKNGFGGWQTTGMAVRCGSKDSITANLHGGGQAIAPAPFLKKRYGYQQSQQIMKQLTILSKEIPEHLEHYYGRLAELGLDFGIDADGHIWIVEANSKPGRSVFTHMHNKEAQKQALECPIHYAHYLLQRKGGMPWKSHQIGTVSRLTHHA